jgi:hypothetical protein
MHDVLGQIYRMREEHDHRLQSLGQVSLKHVFSCVPILLIHSL